MNTLIDHQEFVLMYPFDKVAALALVDRIQEEAGGSRSDALKFVAALRRPGRQTEYLRRAARVMRARTLARSELDALIEDQAGTVTYNRTAVFLVKGFRSPWWSHDAGDTLGDYDTEAVVFVGVRWVLLYYRQLVKIGRYQAMAERHKRRQK